MYGSYSCARSLDDRDHACGVVDPGACACAGVDVVMRVGWDDAGGADETGDWAGLEDEESMSQLEEQIPNDIKARTWTGGSKQGAQAWA